MIKSLASHQVNQLFLALSECAIAFTDSRLGITGVEHDLTGKVMFHVYKHMTIARQVDMNLSSNLT